MAYRRLGADLADAPPVESQDVFLQTRQARHGPSVRWESRLELIGILDTNLLLAGSSKLESSGGSRMQK